MFQERQPSIELTSHQAWHGYSNILYDVPGQLPLPRPQALWPHELIFSTSQKVKNAINRLHFGKAQDHHGLVGEHFLHAQHFAPAPC